MALAKRVAERHLSPEERVSKAVLDLGGKVQDHSSEIKVALDEIRERINAEIALIEAKLAPFQGPKVKRLIKKDRMRLEDTLSTLKADAGYAHLNGTSNRVFRIAGKSFLYALGRIAAKAAGVPFNESAFSKWYGACFSTTHTIAYGGRIDLDNMNYATLEFQVFMLTGYDSDKTHEITSGVKR